MLVLFQFSTISSYAIIQFSYGITLGPHGRLSLGKHPNAGLTSVIMFSYPDFFYYKNSKETASFSLVPSGQPDIDRFIQQKPYWKQPVDDAIYQQKALVIVDWTAAAWSADKISAVEFCLEKLLADGFKLYVWSNGFFVTITEDDLWKIRDNEFLKTIIPEMEPEIKEKIKKQTKIKPDQFFLLNAYWIDALIDQDFSLTRAWKLPINALSNKTEIQITPIKILRFSYPAVKQLCIQAIHFDSNAVHANIQKQVKFLLNSDVELQWEVTSSRPTQSLQSHTETLRRIVVSQLSEQLPSLAECIFPRVNHVEFAGDNPDLIEALLENAPNLRSIVLKASKEAWNKANGKMINKKLNRLSLIFPEKKDLSILPIPAFRFALKKLEEKLKDLTLENYSAEERQQNMPNFCLASLTTLRLNNVKINRDSFLAILLGTQKLEHLSFQIGSIISGEFNNILNLPAILSVSFQAASISIILMEQLFRHSEKIVKMNLRNTRFTDSSLCDDFNFWNLEEFDAKNSNLTGADLKRLLANSKPKTLNLKGCKNISMQDILSLDLSQLDNFNPPQPYAAEELIQLSIKAPNLKKVVITWSCVFDDTLVSQLSLRHLEKLELSNLLTISTDSFEKLMLKLPALRKLVLDARLDRDLHEAFSSKTLESLYFKPYNMSMENLKRIIKNCPQLLYIESLHSKGRPILTAEINQLLAAKIFVHDTDYLSLKDEMAPPDAPNNPEHSHNEFFDYSPMPRHFNYSGLNKSKSQSMVIEQLCQVLTLLRQNVDKIPKIQKGICESLAQYFVHTKEDEWTQRIDLIRNWNGTKELLYKDQELFETFEIIFRYVWDNNLVPKQTNSWAFVGLGFLYILSTRKTPAVLRNPWHAIAVKTFNDSWLVLDPNFTDGYRRVKREELFSVVIKSLGHLIQMQTDDPDPVIQSTGAFLEEGGLLSLVYCENSYDLITDVIQDIAIFTPKNLTGLLLRDVDGKPAWVVGLQSGKTRSLTVQLLEQFITVHGEAAIPQLKNSMACLTNIEQKKMFELLIQLRGKHDRIEKLLFKSVFENNNLKEQFTRRLTTWENFSPQEHFVDQFCQAVFAGKSKILIKSNSDNSTLNCILALQNYRKNSRPIFYVHSPDDLVCSAPYIKPIDARGVLTKGPSGAFYRFLEKHKFDSPIIIINYDPFDGDDIIRTNTIIDKEQLIDTIPLPAGTQIIGVINTENPQAYQGGDFNSRFNEKLNLPFSEEALAAATRDLNIPETNEQTETEVINLYYGQDWKSQLLGRWIMQGDGFVFEEGLLKQAIKTKKPIEIKNGQWDDDEFVMFWKQILIQSKIHGQIETAIDPITIPANLVLKRSEGYDWEKLLENFSYDNASQADALTLNPHTVAKFQHYYVCDNQQKLLFYKPGLIESYKGADLHVNLTASITVDEWARLLDSCLKYQVRLHCHVAPAVLLPKPISDRTHFTTTSINTVDFDMAHLSSTSWCQSTDVDATAELIKADEQDWLLINITELESNDLISRIEDTFDPETLKYSFNEKKCALITALRAKKNIMLLGDPKPSLRDALADLILKRQHKQKPKGKLIIVTSNKTILPATALKHEVTPDIKKTLLKTKTSQLTDKQLQEKSFIELSTLCQYTEKTWEGMYHLPAITPLVDFDPNTSEADAKAFDEQRLKQVFALFAVMPYALITGHTGVAKTTFVEKILKKECAAYFQGFAQVRDWANDETDGLKLLFIDEATLGDRQWTCFEGLFNQPPFILIDGKIIFLTDQHKVIFAGNPLSYGAGRNVPELFKRHGGALVFEPMPLAYIFEKILKPIFVGSKLEDKSLDVIRPILEVYRFLCEHAKTEVAITARECQMMAIQTLAALERNPELDPVMLATHYSYAIAKPWVLSRDRAKFDAVFVDPMSQKSSDYEYIADYCIPPSRHQVATAVRDFIKTQLFKKHKADNDAQRYGGLAALVLESDPGLGKSELITKLLAEAGYVDFYGIPASMPHSEKIELLLKAFDEGNLVVMDEMNSSPMMEELLNALLMGKTLDGKLPKKAGFSVIGTQNPASMGNRSEMSSALAHRSTKIEVQEYEAKEMVKILMNKRVPKIEAMQLVNSYLERRATAKENHLNPVPTFRDVIETAAALKENIYVSHIKSQYRYNQVEFTDVGIKIFDEHLTVNQCVENGIFAADKAQYNRYTFFQRDPSGVALKEIVAEKNKVATYVIPTRVGI